MPHNDEIASDVGLVRALLEAQQPQWSELPIERVGQNGTVNALYRLGDDMVVRLPRRPSATASIDKLHRWLPVLAPQLPLPIPVPLALGEAMELFPWPWSVYAWFDGEDGTAAAFDQRQAAIDVAAFISALWLVDATHGPEPSTSNPLSRGRPLASRDAVTRRAISQLEYMIDAEAATAVWEDALHAEPWNHPGVWIHGDLSFASMIFRDRRLRAVVDFDGLAVGDPAADVAVAWQPYDVQAREVLRAELDVDEATWRRGRGLALSRAMLTFLHYEHTNALVAANSKQRIKIVLAE